MPRRQAQMAGLAARLEHYGYRAAVSLALGIGLTVLVYMAVTWHARLIFAEHPQEYAENAIYLSTVLLQRGQNPWALENVPQYANVYGVLYNLVALPVVAVFGCTFAVHRLLSAFLLLLCCVVIVMVLRRYRTPLLLALVAPIILYQQYMPTHASEARPDNLGLLLFLSALFYPWWRRFSAASLCVATGLSLLALCTKVYFAVGILYLTVYVFLFEGKRKAVIYLVLSLVAVRLLGAAVDSVSVAYWPQVFYMQLNGAPFRWAFLMEQLSWYVRQNRGLLAVVGLLILSGLYAYVRSRLAGAAAGARPTRTGVFSPVRDGRAPLLHARMDFVTFALAFSTFLILARVGWRPGNFGVYFHQLVTPFLLIVVFRALSTGRLPRAVLIALPGLQLLVGLSAFEPLPREDPRQWQDWDALFAAHQEVYAAPVFAHLLVKQGKPVYDAGQAEYVAYGLKGPPTGTVRQIHARLREYTNEFHDKVVRGEFSLIVLWHGGYHYALPRVEMAERYELAEQRECPCALAQITYDIWMRRGAPPARLETLPRDRLALWLRAEAGVCADSTGRVQVWSDQSDLGHQALAATAAQQPQYVPAAETGHAALRFDGIDDTLVVGSLTGPRPSLTLLLVLKPAGLPAHGHSIGATGGWAQFWFHGNARGRIFVGTGDATRITPADGPDLTTLVPGEWQLFTYMTDAESARLYRNGVLLARKPAGRAAPWDGFRLGYPQADDALAGEVGEVALYDRALPDGERRAIEQFLLDEFGIARPTSVKR